MVFTILAAVAGIVVVKNLWAVSGRRPLWLDSSQKRVESMRGNAHVNINLANILTRWSPIYDPRKYFADYTMSKKVKARTDSYSDVPSRRNRGIKEIIKYNYRVNGGVGPEPNTAQIYG